MQTTNDYQIDVRGNAARGYGVWVSSTNGGGPPKHLSFRYFDELKACLTETLLFPRPSIARVKDALESHNSFRETATLDYAVVEQFHRECESRFR